MRNLTWWLAASALLATLGCSGSGSPVTAPQTAPDSATLPQAALGASGALGTPFINGDLATAALAIYTLDIDPVSLQATSRLKETRTVAANDDLYLLSIDSFLNAGSFAITGITATATTIDLGYVVKHPFPAPNNPTGTPNGSTNRADLGVAGMVLIMADAPASGNTYFTDRVANTDLVANADAYFSPGGLLTTSGTANTYPYKQLVDESLDPRVGVSNGGDVTGNFGSDGWTRSEFGTGNNGWTGYGVMHQGQSVTNTMSLNKAALTGGFSLDVSIIAVYNDPRGGATAAQKKANRLPPASPDASLFAYRMPHGALDAGKITVLPETAGFIANTISAQTMSFHVEDWDARATESAEADLANDSSFTNVAQGESGTPTLDVCIPDVLGDATVTADASTVVDDDSGVGGDVDEDSGRPGDALYYSTLVTKLAGSGQVAGFYKGMVRATDPQTGLTIGLNESLAPLPSTPDPVTYQAFTVEMLPDNAAPTGTYAMDAATVAENCAFGLTVTAPNDDDGDPIDILVDWDNDGTYTLATTVNSPYPATVPLASPITFTFNGPAPDNRQVPVRLDDGTTFTQLTPTQSIQVLQNCPTAPFVATPLTSGLGYTGVGGFYNYSATFCPQDMEGMKSGIVHPNGGVIVQQKAAATADLVVFVATAAAPNAGASIFTVTSGFPATSQVNQIDVSATNRVFYSTYVTSQIGTGRNNPLYNYGATGGAANIRYFDLTGVIPYASHTTISTGANRVIAMDVDAAGNVWYIDQNNILHKLTGGSYAEETSCPFPIDLKTISQPMNPTGGTPATNIKVHDFEVNAYSGFLYILAQSQEAAASNAYIYKVACDGSSSTRSAGFALNYSTTQNQYGDIHIDSRDTTGAAISPLSNADRQIVVYGNRMIPNTDPEPEVRIFTADLTQSTSQNWDPFGCCDIGMNNGSVGLNNWLYAAMGPSFGTGIIAIHGTAGNFPPTGWQ
ncbi:MAG: hypothetical protein GEEBNDBF_01457 [bacterium]|nr:hypothetical protein [bacterium]